MPIGRRWSPFHWPSARHQFTLQDHRLRGQCIVGVLAYIPAFTGTHCAYPRRDGQAELTSHYWMQTIKAVWCEYVGCFRPVLTTESWFSWLASVVGMLNLNHLAVSLVQWKERTSTLCRTVKWYQLFRWVITAKWLRCTCAGELSLAIPVWVGAQAVDVFLNILWIYSVLCKPNAPDTVIVRVFTCVEVKKRKLRHFRLHAAAIAGTCHSLRHKQARSVISVFRSEVHGVTLCVVMSRGAPIMLWPIIGAK